MNILEIIEGTDIFQYAGDQDIELKNISINSNKIGENTLFVAIEGVKTDGHQYINSAIAHGAKAILLNEEKIYIVNPDIGVPILTCKDTRYTVALLSQKLLGYPSQKLSLIGITGTNGKTSIATITYRILLEHNQSTALIGTLGEFINYHQVDIHKTTKTTPDSIEFAEFSRLCIEQDIKNIVMEVSSIALKLKRLGNCIFDIGVFTNISSEHMVEHKTFEDYFESKRLLLTSSIYSVINIDDSYGYQMANELKNTMTYSINDQRATVYASSIVYDNDRVSFKVNYQNQVERVQLPIPANYAISNALAVICICLLKGLGVKEIVYLLEKNIQVLGRYEELIIKNNTRVIIDYAHNPAALENLLSSITENRCYNRLITVFGCQGNFDLAKRPKMGAIADQYSDYIIVTSDDPENENPMEIIHGILKGIKKKIDVTLVIPSRKDAIKKAIELSNNNDIIVIAGKGHETVQVVNGQKVPHSDKEEVIYY